MGRGNRANRYSNDRFITRVVDNSGDGESSYTQYSKRTFNQRGGGIKNNFRGDRGKSRFPRGGGQHYQFSRGTFKRAIQNLNSRGGAAHINSDGDLDMDVEQESWCKVTVMFGSNYTREWLHKELARAVAAQFVMYNFRFETKNAVFFIKIRRSQLSVYRNAANGMYSPSNGQKVIMNIVTVAEPTLMAMTDDVLAHIKTSLQSRFNPTNLALNLSAFHKDPELLNKGFYVPFNRAVVISTITQLICENLNELNALNLSDNRLDSLNGFATIIEKFKTLRSIDLSANNFRTINNIEKLTTLPVLEDLNLMNTPFTRRFQTIEQLASHLRERIVSLQRINGKVLPPVAEFEIQKTVAKALPPSQLGCFPNTETQGVLIMLIKTYMDKFDSGRRQQLLPYYSDQSVLTMSSAYHSLNSTSQNSAQVSQRLHTSYMQENRNLLRCRDSERRRKLVKTGPLHIVTLLDTLPRTEHNLESFNVDVIHAAANVVVFRMNGIFFEIGEDNSSGNNNTPTTRVLRAFVRTMVIQPPEIIVQDDLFITNPTSHTCKKFLNPIRPVTSAVTVNSPPSMAGPSSNLPHPTVPIKQEPNVNHDQLVANFSRDSGMNIAFSRKCLEDCAWNFEAAATSFMQLKTAGKIPPQAFS